VFQYSSDQVNIAWIGLPDWADGLALGMSIREKRQVPNNFKYKPNGYGGTVTMFDPNLAGTLTIMFNRESVQHTRLSTFANIDLATHAIVSPMLITDRSTRGAQLYNSCRLAGQLPYLNGSAASVGAWVFIYAQAVSQVFGLNHNLVGS
jgi:hypothetical protein